MADRTETGSYIPYIGVSESEIMVAMTGSLAAEKGWKKGSWTHEEDKLLTEYVSLHGEGRWSSVAKFTGLNRSGKSCRLRWVNYLRPGLKKGQLTPLEEGIIVELHAILGNKWSTIARCLPGRTDNEIKNYWRTHFGKKEKPKHKKLERQRRSKVQKQLKQQQPQAECDIKRILSHKGTKINETNTSETKHIEQVMGFMHPTTLIEQQYYGLPSMHQEISTTWPNTTEDDDDGLWFSLWDFDEPPQGFAHNQYFSKNVVPNQDSFGTGGDSMQNQDVTFGAYDNLCYGKYTFG